MKRFTLIFIVLMLCFSMMAWAGPLSAIKSWFSWTAAAFILSGLLALGVIGKYTPWLSRLLIAIGALLTDTGLALADGKISAAELKQAKDNFITVKNLFKPQVE